MIKKALIIGNTAGAGYRIKKSLDSVEIRNEFIISDNELDCACDPTWENLQAQNGVDFITFSKLLNESDLSSITKRNPASDVKNFIRIRSACKKKEFDFGFAMGVWPILMNSLSIPYVWLCAGSDVREVLSGNSFLSMLLKRALKRCKGIITPADDNMLKILRRYFPENKTLVFPNYPIDTDIYTPKASSNEQFTIYHPARHLWYSKKDESKANDLLLKAVKRISTEHDVKIIMAEWGIDLAHSKQLISDLQMEHVVEWHGMVTKHKMIEYYQNADCVVDHVGWGMVSQTSLEGLACGKPTLANMSSSVKSLFPDIPVFSVASEEDCYCALKKLITDKKMYLQTCEISRAWIDSQWSVRALGPKIKTFLNQL
ncbi:glycosyltransferase [Maridesulfovibrio sp.]|uniref:glycosyltransferase n=1 Tax=Maridesulfovibrio sp. TaxID=2795000 RepID=UPI002A18D3CA|nr:glycosyltransferase [Maridesulfovibrio sp.]